LVVVFVVVAVPGFVVVVVVLVVIDVVEDDFDVVVCLEAVSVVVGEVRFVAVFVVVVVGLTLL
jgi:hypothetical protein